MTDGRPGASIEARMAATRGHATGFDYLRIGLALLIVLRHTVPICYGGDAQYRMDFSVMRPLWAAVLPMFFALSGFLVAGSLERSPSLVSFLALRITRLGPALLVESLLAIVVGGLLFTSLPILKFLTDPTTRSYLLNMIGDIHYYLPGVFTHNPSTRVNLQLWTLPYELKCYAALTMIALIRGYKNERLFIICIVLSFVLVEGLYIWRNRPDSVIMDNPGLIACFLFGVALYRFRARVPWSWRWGAASLVIGSICLCFRETQILSAPFAAYVTVWLGLYCPRKIWPLTTGDYSYPIFLYGWPVQQAVWAMAARDWWSNLPVSLVFIGALSWVSWTFVEKPSGQWAKPRMKQLEARTLELVHRLPFGRALLPRTN